jgi:PAS domain S-box-containing protein
MAASLHPAWSGRTLGIVLTVGILVALLDLFLYERFGWFIGCLGLVAGALSLAFLARLLLARRSGHPAAEELLNPERTVPEVAVPDSVAAIASTSRVTSPALDPSAQKAKNPDQEARLSGQRFRQLAESIGAVFWMSDLHKQQVIYVSAGYEKIWGRSCASLYASARDWIDAIHPEDRDRVFNSAMTRQASGDYDEEYRILRPDGSIRWIRDRAFPVRAERGEVDHIAGIAEDITDRKRLEKEVIEISDREQRRLGQDLHDGICQQLVSIAFATDLLRRDLVAKSPHDAIRLARITALLDNAILQARHLSHALYPVNLVGNGLGFALNELAGSISQGYHVDCVAQCSETILIRDNALAIHLYRIAQEAVQNATKYADPSRILICLSHEEDTVYLSVSDNGAGMNDDRAAGVGLSIMRYRASMAGGRLDVQRGPLGGTIISVAVPSRPPAPIPEPERHHKKPAQPLVATSGLTKPAEPDRIMACSFQEQTPLLSTHNTEKAHLADI